MATALRRPCVALVAIAMVPAAFAQPVREGAGVRLDVSGYAVEGHILFKGEDFTRIIAPFVGRRKTMADIERARDSLQQAYHDLGYCSARILLVPPVPQDGVVIFRLAEMPAGETRNCLPAIVLDEWKKPGTTSPAVAGAGVVYPSADAGYSPESPPSRHGLAIAAKFDTGISTQPVSWFPSKVVPAQRSQSPVMLQASAQIVAQAEPVKQAPASTQTPQPASRPVAEKAVVQVTQGPPAAAPVEVAPAAPAAAPKFEIRRYQIEGSTLLSRQRRDQVLAPFTGPGKDFGDVQRALEALQGAYQAEGYGSVEVRLPEQELERGEVKFTVIEAKIGKITVEGNEHFTSANIRRSVPALKEGVTPNSRDIGQAIRLANENPAKQSTVLLKGAEQEGVIDATVRVADIRPTRYSISLDNTGNENTGRARLGLAYQHANLFDRDHVLTTQFLTSPVNPNDVKVFGLGYRIPLYTRGDSIDFVAGYSDVDSGTVQDLFAVTGRGAVYALRYNHGLPKWGDIDHRLAYGLDYRAYQNNVIPVGGTANLVPDITVHPFSVTYAGAWRQEKRELSFFLSFVQNLPGMNDGTDDIFKQARFLVGTAGYRIFRFGGGYSTSFLGDWQARIRLDAQYSEDSLVTGEQFAIGGADNVRGFNERFTSNDKGYRTNWEIYTPDWAKPLGLSQGRLRFLTFYDTGTTKRNQPVPGEVEAVSLDSVGMGFRLSYKDYFTTRFDVAHILHDGTQGFVQDGKRNINKIHFSMAWVW